MIGTKFYKENYDNKSYADCAVWCNQNNATITDRGEYYECIALPEPEPPTIEEIKQQLINAVQNHMDATAQTRDYDSIASACSYGLSTVDKFRNEAIACIAWRDAVWSYCYKQLDLFESGGREVPTVEELINELPTLEWEGALQEQVYEE